MFPSMSAFDPIEIRPQHFMLGEGDSVLSKNDNICEKMLIIKTLVFGKQGISSPLFLSLPQ